MNQLKGDCIVFYADQGHQLYNDEFMKKIGRKLRRKIFECLDVAEQSISRKSIKHSIVPINIPTFNFKYLILVRIEPWDGHSRHKIEQKIYDSTISYL